MPASAPTPKPTININSLQDVTVQLTGIFDSWYNLTSLENNNKITTKLTYVINSTIVNTQQIPIVNIYWNQIFYNNSNKKNNTNNNFIYQIDMVWLITVTNQGSGETITTYTSSSAFIHDLNISMTQQNLTQYLQATRARATLYIPNNQGQAKSSKNTFWKNVAKWFSNNFMLIMIIGCILLICIVCCVTYALRYRARSIRRSSIK